MNEQKSLEICVLKETILEIFSMILCLLIDSSLLILYTIMFILSPLILLINIIRWELFKKKKCINDFKKMKNDGIYWEGNISLSQPISLSARYFRWRKNQIKEKIFKEN